jgi:flavorubredoxin
MALSGKYGKLNVPTIGADEPVFVLRAQDKLAETTIEMYRLLAASHGLPLARAVQKEIETFRQWKGRKKMPD